MTDNVNPRSAEEAVGSETSEPATAAATGPEAGAEQVEAEQEAVAQQEPAGEASPQPQAGSEGGPEPQADAAPQTEAEAVNLDAALAAERLLDLQRLQAEYVNYKRRVDRDRAMVQERAVQDVLEALLPVLDDIHGAREHGDLQGGPFAAIAEKLENTLGKLGLTRFGEAGEPFDPMLHEALMHTQAELPDGAETTTIVTVLQPGYRAGDSVIRPARVAVADPQ